MINIPTHGSNSPANYHSDIETSSNSRMSPVEVDVCFPTPNKKEEGGIDYEALEEFITLEKKELAEDRHDTSKKRRRRLSTMGGSEGRRYSLYGDRMMVCILYYGETTFS
jgi:hypothetical protein